MKKIMLTAKIGLVFMLAASMILIFFPRIQVMAEKGTTQKEEAKKDEETQGILQDINDVSKLPSGRLQISVGEKTLEIRNLTFKFKQASSEHGIFDLIAFQDADSVKEEGKPQLPAIYKWVEVPADSEARIALSKSDYIEYQNVTIYPVPKKETVTTREGYSYIKEKFFMDRHFYKKHNKFYPGLDKIVTKGKNGLLGETKITSICIHPFQFNPVTKTLRYYYNLEVDILFRQKKPATIQTVLKNQHENQALLKTLQDTILNYTGQHTYKQSVCTKDSILRNGTVARPTSLKAENSADYLIITADKFYNSQSLDELANHRASFNGYNVAIVRTTDIYREFPPPPSGTIEPLNFEGGDISIKNFITYVYNYWQAPITGHLGFVLLVGEASWPSEGDYSNWINLDYFLPTHRIPMFLSGFFVTDYWYSCINDDDGNGIINDDDPFGDTLIGRLSAYTEDELAIQVSKIINYENNPPPANSWGSRVLLLNGMSPSEVDPHRIDYIRDEFLLPNHIECLELHTFDYSSNERRDRTVSLWNQGGSILRVGSHGSVTVWAGPVFRSEDVQLLSNGNQLPVVYNESCRSGNYASTSDCVGEKIVKTSNKGGIAYIGYSETGFGGTDINFMKAVFTNHNTVLGSAILEEKMNSYFQNLSPKLTQMQNLLGDPALDLSIVISESNKAELVPAVTMIPSSRVEVNTQAIIKIEIQNIGKTDAPDILTRVYDGNPANGGIQIGNDIYLNSIAVGTSEVIEVPWLPTVSGFHLIYVQIDPENLIPELSKYNNEVSVYVDAYVNPPDTTPPTGSITINNGAIYTTSPWVTLTLSAVDNTPNGMGPGAQMRFSNDNSKWSKPEPYAEIRKARWLLRPGCLHSYVYVKFKDAAGNESQEKYFDHIILLPPVITINKGADGTPSPIVTLELLGPPSEDLSSGIITMMSLSNDNKGWFPKRKYEGSISWDLDDGFKEPPPNPNRTVYVRFQYQDGSWSNTYSATVTLIPAKAMKS